MYKSSKSPCRKRLLHQPKWTPPQPKSNRPPIKWDPPVPRPTSTPHMSTAPVEPPLFFYPLYTGWMFPDSQVIFGSPSEAAAWAISRFKRDGLSNVWGPDCYPEFLHFVGSVSTTSPMVIPMPQSTKTSKIEQSYFGAVSFYTTSIEHVVHCSYTKLNASLFLKVAHTMKPTQCYQSSSGSVYRKNMVCPLSTHQDVHFTHSPFLSMKKPPNRGFINLMTKFKYLKSNTYIDHGKHSHSFFVSLCNSPLTKISLIR